MTDRHPAAHLARYFHVPVGTIHRWAHEDKWERRRIRGVTEYSMDDAQKSYDTRGRERRDALRRGDLTRLR